ncbi:MAG TPA: DinB family protein [Fimbriimonadaceae bacterium]|nr:DinB family protein [Fimbriimonadaceae bacterium]
MNPYLLNTLEMGPAIVRRLLHHLPQARLDEALSPDRFTPREAIAHLADWEEILLARMQRTLAEPGHTILGMDESVRAEEQGYRTSDIWQQADSFQQRRKRTAEWLRSLPTDAWRATATHNERGPQSLYDQANLLLGHDLYHIEHLTLYLEPKTAGTW